MELPESPDWKRVSDGLRNYNAALNAWEIIYETNRGPKGAYVRRVVAAKAPDKFLSWNAHGTPYYSWQQDPIQQRLTVNGSSAIGEYPFQREFHRALIKDDDPLPGSAPHDLLFIALGWWPFEKRSQPILNGIPLVLPGIAASRSYKVLPKQDSLNGRSCCVIEFPAHDRIWLDRVSNFIVARELLDPASGRVLERVEGKSFETIHGRFTVPIEFKNTLYNYDHGSLTSTSSATIKLTSVLLNQEVGDGSFHFQPLPGSIERFDNGAFVQVEPGGHNYLDDCLGLITDQRPSRSIHLSTSVESWFEIVMIACCLAAILTNFVANKMRRLQR